MRWAYAGIGEVESGDGPGRGALIDRHALDVRLDRRHHLDRTASGPDHGDALAGKIDIVAPLGGMECRAPEGVKALELRNLGHRELTAGGDQYVGLMITVIGCDQPPAS
jgi:hypothetical protein